MLRDKPVVAFTAGSLSIVFAMFNRLCAALLLSIALHGCYTVATRLLRGWGGEADVMIGGFVSKAATVLKRVRQPPVHVSQSISLSGR